MIYCINWNQPDAVFESYKGILISHFRRTVSEITQIASPITCVCTAKEYTGTEDGYT